MKKAIVNYLSWVVFLSLVLTAGVADADIHTGLVAHWKFDETSGTTASDSSGNNQHASLENGAFFTAGQIRNGVEMDGTDDYVDLPIGSLISSLTNSTFATWANFSNEIDHVVHPDADRRTGFVHPDRAEIGNVPVCPNIAVEPFGWIDMAQDLNAGGDWIGIDFRQNVKRCLGRAPK